VTEATIINMPTEMYNYEAPDALDLPWDSAAAKDLISVHLVKGGVEDPPRCRESAGARARRRGSAGARVSRRA
jgi:hypothetical protein